MVILEFYLRDFVRISYYFLRQDVLSPHAMLNQQNVGLALIIFYAWNEC